MSSPPVYAVSTVLVSPYVLEKDGGGYEGFIVDLLDAIAKQAGFKYSLYPSKDGRYGGRAADGRWNGMIGEVIRRETDIAAGPLTITSERERVVDFTSPFMQETVSLLVATPPSPKVNYGMLLHPFADTVWLSILIAMVAVAVLLMLIGRFSPYEWRQVPADKDPRGARHSFGLRNSFMFVVSTLTLQGYRETPRSLAGRVLTVSWFIFIFLTVVAYISNVCAMIMVGVANPMPSLPFHNLEDLSEDSSIQVGIIRNGLSFRKLKDSQVPVYRKLAHIIEARNSFVNTTSEGVERVRHSYGDFVMLMETSLAKHAAAQDCSMMVHDESIFPSGFGFAVQTGSPLRQMLNMAIMRLREEGVIQMLQNKWWAVSRCFTPQLAPKPRSGLSGSVMYMRRIAAPFIILLVGAILSILVLVGEIVFRKLRPSSQDQTST